MNLPLRFAVNWGGLNSKVTFCPTGGPNQDYVPELLRIGIIHLFDYVVVIIQTLRIKNSFTQRNGHILTVKRKPIVRKNRGVYFNSVKCLRFVAVIQFTTPSIHSEHVIHSRKWKFNQSIQNFNPPTPTSRLSTKANFQPIHQRQLPAHPPAPTSSPSTNTNF